MSITGRSSNLEPMRVQLWPQQWGGSEGGGLAAHATDSYPLSV